MEYQILTPEQQKQIRDQTILQIESEHYSTSLARERAVATAQPTEHLDAHLATLDAQHASLQDQEVELEARRPQV